MYVKYRGDSRFELGPRLWLAGAAILLVLITGLLIAVTGARQPAGEASASLLVSEGTVSVYQTGRGLFGQRTRQIVARPRETISVGANQSVVVGQNARARLSFPDGSYAEMEPGAALRLTTLAEADAAPELRVNLTSGRMTSYIRPRLVEGVYEIVTPSVTVSATGTVFTVEVVSEQATIVSCAEGEVVVWTGREQIALSAGETIAAISGAPLVASGPGPTPEPTRASLKPGDYSTPRPPEMLAPALADVLANPRRGSLSRTVVVAAPAVLPAEAVAPPPPSEPVDSGESPPPPPDSGQSPPPAPPPDNGNPNPPGNGNDGDNKDGDPNDGNNGRGNDGRDNGNQGRGNGNRGNGNGNSGRGNNGNNGQGRGNGGDK